jgi:hypothetical protein
MMMRSGRMRSALRTRDRCVISPALYIGRARFHAHHMRLLQLQLGRILDGDHAFRWEYSSREC